MTTSRIGHQHATKRATWNIDRIMGHIMQCGMWPWLMARVKPTIWGIHLETARNVRSVSSRSSNLTAIAAGNGRRPPHPQMRPSTSRNSIAEDLLTLRTSANFPADFMFTDPEAYKEVEVVFQRPRCIHAVSFQTTADDRQFDPLCWEIDGSIDGHTWMRLQTQSCEFDVPAPRRRAVDTFFVTEPWCKPGPWGAPASSSRVDLQKIPTQVSERLCFFASSLRSIVKGTQNRGIRPGRDTLLDRKMGAVPTLTQVVPVYEETVILTEEFLCASDGRNTNLGFVIAQVAWLIPIGTTDHWEGHRWTGLRDVGVQAFVSLRLSSVLWHSVVQGR